MTAAAYIYEAVRTPFGRYGGALAGVRPDDLAAHALRALLGRVHQLDPARIDDVILGNANGAGEENRDVAATAHQALDELEARGVPVARLVLGGFSQGACLDV
jgi:acetyl-CoA acetyltransferase